MIVKRCVFVIVSMSEQAPSMPLVNCRCGSDVKTKEIFIKCFPYF